MTDLDPTAAAHFIRGPNFVSATDATARSGIAALVPDASIDDYVFEPCGYSMNGIAGDGFITIHITPEADFSYASVEISGVHPEQLQPARIAQMSADIFRPGRLSVALSWDGALQDDGRSWAESLLGCGPAGFNMRLSDTHDLHVGGSIEFSIFEGPTEAATHVGELTRQQSELMLVDLDMPEHEAMPGASSGGVSPTSAFAAVKAAGGSGAGVPASLASPLKTPVQPAEKAFASVAVAI